MRVGRLWGGERSAICNGDDGLRCGGGGTKGERGAGFGFWVLDFGVWGLGFGPLLKGRESGKPSSGIMASLDYVLGPILRENQGLGFRPLFRP